MVKILFIYYLILNFDSLIVKNEIGNVGNFTGFFAISLLILYLYNKCVCLYYTCSRMSVCIRREKNLWKIILRKNILEGLWRRHWDYIYRWTRRLCWTAQLGSGVLRYCLPFCGLVTTKKCCPDKISEKHSYLVITHTRKINAIIIIIIIIKCVL